MKYWTGTTLTPDQINGTNNIFVFGSNPEGRHGMGAAKAAMGMGAKYGIGRGLQGNTYALPTKNISKTLPYHEEASGITYTKSGKCSISLDQIRENLRELIHTANAHSDKEFIIAYHNTGTTLNGYSPSEIIGLLTTLDYVPDNISIHESFRPISF